jgi:hypothetical protein
MSGSDKSRRPDTEVHDEALAALYRQAARDEPSPRHDAAILAAAAADLARPASARRAWWPRWRMGLSLAVTIVLSAGLVLLVEREQARTPAGEGPAASRTTPRPLGAESPPASAAPEAPPAPAAPPRQETDEGHAANSAAPGGLSQKRAAPRSPMEASKARSDVSAETPAPIAAPRSPDAAWEEDRAAAPEPPSPASKPSAAFPGESKPLGKAEGTPSAVSPYSITAPAGSAPPSALPGAADAPGTVRQRGAMEASPGAEAPQESRDNRAPTRGDAAPAVAAPRPPEVWLAEIRSLYQAGRDADARTALQAFRRAYPEQPIPEDLRALQTTERRMR